MLKKVFLKIVFVILCVFFGVIFTINPIFWWLYATRKPDKTKEELTIYTREILEKYINSIKLLLNINTIPEIMFTESNKSDNTTMGGFRYQDNTSSSIRSAFSNWIDELLDFHYEPTILMNGITNELGYNIHIEINAVNIYCHSLVFNNPIIYRFYLIYIAVHELTHYTQFKREELQIAGYVTASTNFIAYKKQPVEKEANKMARKHIMKNFIKILVNK